MSVLADVGMHAYNNEGKRHSKSWIFDQKRMFPKNLSEESSLARTALKNAHFLIESPIARKFTPDRCRISAVGIMPTGRLAGD